MIKDTAQAFLGGARWGRDNWFWNCMPYCFRRLDISRKHVWLPLNRRYKPLGVVTKQWVIYEEYLPRSVVFARDPQGFKDIWLDPVGPDSLYLYSDIRSRNDYWVRLDRLCGHKMLMFTHEKYPVGL